jgi:hypothetical protein
VAWRIHESRHQLRQALEGQPAAEDEIAEDAYRLALRAKLS